MTDTSPMTELELHAHLRDVHELPVPKYDRVGCIDYRWQHNNDHAMRGPDAHGPGPEDRGLIDYHPFRCGANCEVCADR